MKHLVMIQFGELFLKSEGVRRYYVRILTGSIHTALDAAGLEHTIHQHRGRILISGEDSKAIANIVSHIFGVVGVARCICIPTDKEEIARVAADMSQGKLHPGMTFAVRARRSGVEGFTSQELGAYVGSALWFEGLKVDLSDPDYALYVEARHWGTLIYDTILPGPGGLPLGTQARVLSLLSAGIDSPVASWLVMRRGCPTTFLNLDGGAYAGSGVNAAVITNFANLSHWSPGRKITLLQLNMESFYEALLAEDIIKNRCILCKRFMLRVAVAVAQEEKVAALVMGDTIGQVASQTLENLGVTDSLIPSDLLLLRPLITNDKQETVDRARAIGTFQESPGDLSCAVVPKHPAVAATIDVIKEEEAKLDIASLVKTVILTKKVFIACDGAVEEIVKK